VAGDKNGTSDAFARDMDQGVTYLVSINTNGVAGNAASSVPVISANGRYVAFLSAANDLVTNDFNTLNDVFVHDLQTRTTKLVSVNVAGTGSGNRLSFDPVISADGRYIAFASQATNLVLLPDTNDFPDVFVRDMVQGVTKLVSVNATGTAAGGNGGNNSLLPASQSPFLSEDGTKVLFVSLAADLVANDTNGKQDVFLRDHVNGTTTLISTNRFGTGAGNGASGIGAFSMSTDVRYVAFFSSASDIGPADLNGKTDVFLRDLQSGTTKIISRATLGGFAGTGHSYQPVMSADGSTVLFTSEADNLDDRDHNGVTDILTAAPSLPAPSFGTVDVGLSVSSVGPQTVGSNFTLTITVTNGSSTTVTGVVVTNRLSPFMQYWAGTASQGGVVSNSWVVGDLAAGGSAAANVTMIANQVGQGEVVYAFARLDQADSNLNNNSALAEILINRTGRGAFYYLPGKTPYLSRTNSPYFGGILSGDFTLEDFESGVFQIPGVSVSTGVVQPPSSMTDSVDADDGLIDGSGTGGHSFLVADTNTVTFTFDAGVFGRFPTKVGIALTDGRPDGVGFEAFDSTGASLGITAPAQVGDNASAGETAEDRFVGVEFAGGISALRVYYPVAGFEVDHLQFDIPRSDLVLASQIPGTNAASQAMTLAVSVTNLGPATATAVVVSGLDFLKFGPANVTLSQGVVDPANSTWTIDSLAVGSVASLTAVLNAPAVGSYSAVLRVMGQQVDRNLRDNTNRLAFIVTNSPPTITLSTNLVVVLEDSGAFGSQSFASFGVGPANESGQTITNVTVLSVTN
ncbi:MAG: DUF11 domain-containing protein, partial [Proteobacteria bacterium]|nr:DUF11 domain-containing protein [Pseudomonadota bacterium]